VAHLQVWKGGGSFDAFHALDAEKQTRIVNAALAEFAVKGFKRASTNAIAENAQIGKGMLFYYFGSKDELFDFLCQYAIEFTRNRYVRRVESDSGDFLLRHKALTDAKRSAMAEFPEVFALFESFYREENEPYFSKFADDIADIKREVYSKIYDGVDYSLFREDMDGRSVVKYLRWMMDAYETETAERLRRGELDANDGQSLAAEWSRFYAFTDDLRKAYYKEGKSDGNH
jgi:AcrR family transcriptional regulator